MHRKQEASFGSNLASDDGLKRGPKAPSVAESMASSVDRSRSRRERTFVGSECAVCEEPLEHTLRGERILQFSCSHVSHEACFYEFIREFESQYCPACNAPLHLDTSRGGNVLDIGKKLEEAQGRSQERGLTGFSASTEKITNMVRASSDTRSHSSTPTWDNQTLRAPSIERHELPASNGRESVARSRESQENRYQRGHARSDSEATGVASSGGYPETMQSGPARRHDYDLQAMETTPGSPRPVARNPIPAPIVTVRSEFPTINKSRQQQSLTCLITVEVPDNKWRPDPEDLATTPAMPPLSARMEDGFARPPSPARSTPRFYPYEAPEILEEMTENLRGRVDNWHGLDFSR
jgi:hypothetical protein